MDGDQEGSAFMWQLTLMKQLVLPDISLSSLNPADESRMRTRMQPVLKEIITNYFMVAWKHLCATQQEIKLLKRTERESSEKIVLLQNETICLQRELIENKQEQLQQLKSIVEPSVKTSVEQEMSKNSKIVDLSTSEISTASHQKAVAEEEGRDTNGMVFGQFEESSQANLAISVGEVFSELDEKPKLGSRVPE